MEVESARAGEACAALGREGTVAVFSRCVPTTPLPASSVGSSAPPSPPPLGRRLRFDRGPHPPGGLRGALGSLGSSLGNAVFPSESGYLKRRAEVGEDPGNGAPRTHHPRPGQVLWLAWLGGRQEGVIAAGREVPLSRLVGSLADRTGVSRSILVFIKRKRFQNHFKLNYSFAL